jgi:DNA polymerase III delta prime subunit
MKQLWTEKYRPKRINEYVYKDTGQKRQIETWIKDGSFPHLLLSGSAGIGKTTLAKILINEIGIPDYDFLEINASRENNVDTVRDKIINFVQMIPFGPFKVVLLDEADYLTPNAQAILRGVMETYSDHSRFILTCNYPNKILPAIHSRCQGFHVEKTDQIEFTARIATILVEEGIEFELDDLDTFVKLKYPDMRKCINIVQQHCTENKLHSPQSIDDNDKDWKIEMINLFKNKKIQEARKLICSKIRSDEIGEMYTWLYQNIELFGVDEDTTDKALIIIKQGAIDHGLIADPEINLSATLIKLKNL